MDAHDQPLDLTDMARVSLWHPVFSDASATLAWRDWLERHEITQPFKQAHREVYLLTDAERAHARYSNRFAAHILRQHQFNALCAARGWKNKLRLMVDDTTRRRAWTCRSGGCVPSSGSRVSATTTAPTPTTPARISTWRPTRSASTAWSGSRTLPTPAVAATAQRRRRTGTGRLNEPLPLEQIPPLVFSEVMRDVDLFVGVASVGNDPTWQDGGPGRPLSATTGSATASASSPPPPRRASSSSSA